MALNYAKRKSFLKKLNEFHTYFENNLAKTPNYGEKWRHNEIVSTAFVESTVKEVMAKRMAKKQQMQWSQRGARTGLQTRTATLSGEFEGCFQRWYPVLAAANDSLEQSIEQDRAA